MIVDRKIYCTILTLFIFSFNLFSQETSIFNNYYPNPFIINPAITGAEYYPVVALSAKKQWVGFPDAPSTYLLSANYRIGTYDFYDPKGLVNKGPLQLKDRIGLGAAIYADHDGPSDFVGGVFSYAYHVPVTVKSRLSLGMAVSGTNYIFNSSILKPAESGDNYLLSRKENVFRVNFNFGVYYHSNTYFIGLSSNKILPGYTQNDNIKELPSYFLMGGYKFLQKKIYAIEPSITVKKIGKNNVTVDLFSKFYIDRHNWAALSYSTSGKINLLFGIHLMRMLYVAYNYEYTTSKIASYNYGSHEIYLGINLGLLGIEGIRNTVK